MRRTDRYRNGQQDEPASWAEEEAAWADTPQEEPVTGDTEIYTPQAEPAAGDMETDMPQETPGEDFAWLQETGEAWQDAPDGGLEIDTGFPADEDGADYQVYGEQGETEPEAPPAPADDALREKHSFFKPAVRQPHFVLSVAVNVVRILIVVALLAGLAGLGAVAGIAKGYVETAPSLNLAALDEQEQTSFIYDAKGYVIAEYKGTENRVMVSLAAMPVDLQHAFVAVEDARFYTHNGIDLKRIVGAFVSNLSSSSTQGGSTITQQLIKNTLLSSEQSYKRKIHEAYLAMQLEETYTKEQILESYLNTIYLGENYYGVQTAAQGYFGKGMGQLTLRECAMLAGVTNSPYYYNPRRNFYTREKEGVDYAKITNDRTDYVLRCMYENQFITYDQYRAALDPATAQVLREDPSGGEAIYSYPHYIEYAVSEVVDILLQLNNLENTSQNRAAMEAKFRTGGYRVQLAIDTDIQETVQSTLENWTKYPTLRDPNDKVYRTKNADGTYDETVQPQAAAVVLDYRTGEIKAIVGSRSTPTARKTLNRATDMKMPVGSSIKPIAVYAPALERGSSPASIVFNMPLPITGWKNNRLEDTWPKNYSGSSYTGPTTLRESMRRSYNTAAAQTMMNLVGVSNAVEYLHRLGVDDDHIDATPFGVTLGSSGITPMQMTVAYGVLANGGVYQEPISVLGISDSEGRTIWDGHANQERRRVFAPSTSYMIVDMLKTVVSSGTGTSAKISGQTVAGKTGTNSDQRGVFFAGMTGYYASSLWVGHDNYKALSGKSTGSGAAAPLWQAYMSKIHSGKGNQDILQGDASQWGVVRVTTCAVSGQLATDACYHDAMGYGTVTDWWADGTQPTVTCQLHHEESVCADTGMAASPYCTNVVTQAVITLPQGHPLYSFIGTEYEDELREYLGSYVTGAGETCTLHTGYQLPAQQDTSGAIFYNDAMSLINQAVNMLYGMDPSSRQYSAMQTAIVNLQTLLASGSYSQAQVINAMSALTQAMAGFY